jgi:HK97 gp10 family phage protein
MISVKADIKSINKTLKVLDSLGEKVRKSAEKEIERSARNIEGKAKRNAPTGANNRLKTSIDVRGSGLSREVFTDVKYAPYVEFGTKSKVDIPPGLEGYAMQFKGKKGGSYEDMEKSIKVWAKRKGIPEEAIYPIIKSILHKGTKAQPFLFPAFFAEQPQLLKRLKGVLRGIK